MRLSSTALSGSSPFTKLATVERFRELRELHQEPLLDFVVRTTKHYECPEHLAPLGRTTRPQRGGSQSRRQHPSPAR